MDLNGYFNPVSLERPAFHLVPEEYSFSRNITIHTPNQPIKGLHNYQLALIGVPQDEGAFIKGSASAPDEVRGLLYQLRKLNNNVKIYDLGNLKITRNINDTYYAIRDISLELMELGVIPFFIGGSQDLTFGMLESVSEKEDIKHLLSIDPRFDFWSHNQEKMHSRNYLNYILDKDHAVRFTYTNIGHQQYFVTQEQQDLLEKHHMESMRLGDLRESLKKVEPLIRDADLMSIDMNAVRHSDAPGVTTPSPNGLFGDELCALCRYAGISGNIKICGLFELSPEKDLNSQTSHLAAQAIWYFVDGLSHKIHENPYESGSHTKKFIINQDQNNHELVFYKSTLTGRWWMEIPVKNTFTKQNFFISCSYEDYQQACNNEIPDRWWRYFYRYST